MEVYKKMLMKKYDLFFIFEERHRREIVHQKTDYNKETLRFKMYFFLISPISKYIYIYAERNLLLFLYCYYYSFFFFFLLSNVF